MEEPRRHPLAVICLSDFPSQKLVAEILALQQTGHSVIVHSADTPKQDIQKAMDDLMAQTASKAVNILPFTVERKPATDPAIFRRESPRQRANKGGGFYRGLRKGERW